MTNPGLIDIAIPRTVFGPGAIDRIGEVAAGFAPTKVLIVTDPGVAAAGIADTVQTVIADAGLVVEVFDRCRPEAPASIVAEIAAVVRGEGYDLLVGLGGGSSMDSTKAASLLGGDLELEVEDLIGGQAASAAVTKILVPTTAGTGSEWSPVAVLTDETDENRTFACVDMRNRADAVVIDPDLTLGLPARVTADTGIDALTHAIEAYTCSRPNLITDMFAARAIELIAQSIRPAYARGALHPDARYRLSIAAAMAMYAASEAALGLAHLMNHAVARKARISHGSTVGLLLPYVMEYNLISAPERFAEIARLLGQRTEGLPVMEAARASVTAVRGLLDDLDMPRKLSEVGIADGDIKALAKEFVAYQAPVVDFMAARLCNEEEAAALLRRAL